MTRLTAASPGLANLNPWEFYISRSNNTPERAGQTASSVLCSSRPDCGFLGQKSRRDSQRSYIKSGATPFGSTETIIIIKIPSSNCNEIYCIGLGLWY